MRKDVVAQKGTAIAIMQENLKEMDETLELAYETIRELKDSDKEIKKELEEKKELLEDVEKIVKDKEDELNKKGEKLENTELIFKIGIGAMLIISIFLLIRVSLIRMEMDYINMANETVIGVQLKEDLKEKYIEFAKEKGIEYNSLKSTSNNIKVFETFELDTVTDNQIKKGIEKLRTNEFNIEIEDVNFPLSTIKGYKVYLQE